MTISESEIYVLFLPENLIKCVTLFGPLYDRIFRALRARVFLSPENRSNSSSFFFSQIFRGFTDGVGCIIIYLVHGFRSVVAIETLVAIPSM